MSESARIIETAYCLIEELRCGPEWRSRTQLADQLRQDRTAAVRRAFVWLAEVRAPIRYSAHRRRWTLTDSDYRIPYRLLSAQARLWELERIIEPGNESDLLETVKHVIYDRRALRLRLTREAA